MKPVSINDLKPGCLVRALGSFYLTETSDNGDPDLDSNSFEVGETTTPESILLLLEAPVKLTHPVPAEEYNFYAYEGKFLYNGRIYYLCLKENDDYGIEIVANQR